MEPVTKAMTAFDVWFALGFEKLEIELMAGEGWQGDEIATLFDKMKAAALKAKNDYERTLL